MKSFLHFSNCLKAETFFKEISLKIIFAMLALAMWSINANAQCFTPLTFTPTSQSPITTIAANYYATSADFNNDGYPDLVVTNNNTSHDVYYYRGHGDGTYDAGVAIFVNASLTAQRGIVSADFNGDGNMDIAIANQTASSIYVMYGNGDGTFQTATAITVGASPSTLTVGYFNNDSYPDLAVANHSASPGSVTILLSNGSGGGFTTSATITETGAIAGAFMVTVGDFNHDTKADIALVNTGASTNGVQFVLGNGDGTFSSTVNAISLPFTTSGPTSLTSADYTGDGNIDIAVPDRTNGKVEILIGNGSGGFSTSAEITTGPAANAPNFLTTADFNNDGYPDIAVGDAGSANSTVLLNNGSGGFSTVNITGVNITWSLLPADINGDGRIDLISLNDPTASLSVLLNTTALPTASAVSPVCAGGTINLMAGTVAGATYAWSGPNSFTSTLQNPSIASITSAAAGTYSLTVTASGPCTATASTSVAVSSGPAPFNQTITACGSYTVGATTHTSSGTYTDHLTSVAGCDSTVTTNLTINSVSTSSQTLTRCLGQSITVNGNTYTSTGTYVDKFTGGAHDGCDSIVTTNLTVYYGTGGAANYSSQITSGVNSSPYYTAIGDFNGDGKLDFALTSNNNANVWVYLGNGSGGFGAGTSFPVGTNPRGVVTADFNGDGKLDLAVANAGTTTVTVLLGTGTGSFTTKATLTAGTGPFYIVTADFNGDGKADLAVSNSSSDNVSVFLGDGTGNFTLKSTTPTLGSDPNSIAVGDFNGDGKPDMAVLDQGSNDYYILTGVGDGTFTASAAQTGSPAFNQPWQIIATDFNSDGKLDLALNNRNNATISVMLGNGNGTFGSETTFSTGSANSPLYLVSGDFNGDGKQDIATANYGNNTLTIFLGNGAGSFTTSLMPTTGSSPWSIYTADFNGDGEPDLLDVDGNGPSVSVFINNALLLSSAGATTPVCTSGSNSSLTLMGPAGIATYSWKGPNSYTSSIQSPVIASPTTAVAGVYTLTVSDTHGCTASASTAAVVVNSAKTFTQTITACGSYTVGATTHTSNGTYTDVITTVGGCDSTVTTNLTINSVSTSSQTLTVCSGQSITVNGHTYTSTGTYVDKFTGGAHDGCDSIVTTNLTVYYGTGGAANYSAQITTGVNGSPYYTSIGDFNGDGKLDFALTSNNNANVWVYLGNGTGGFGAGTSFPVGTNPRGVVTGDFNGDGKLDLAVANAGGTTVTVLLGNGGGSFTFKATLAAGTSPFYIVTADFNDDGKADLAVSNSGSSSVSVFLGDGTGNFTLKSTPGVGNDPNSIAVGDFNGDGKPDMAVVDQNSNDYFILTGVGDGTFTASAAQTGSPAFNQPWQIIATDFNSDGKLDLALNNRMNATISVMLGNGNGTFGSETTFSTGSSNNPFYLVSGDFNGDGKQDIATANESANTLTIFLGNGAGSFTTSAMPVAGSGPWSIYAADFNGDGRPDLLDVNALGSSVSVFINNASLSAAVTATSPVCTSGSNSSLTLTGPAGITTYSWTGPNSYTSSVQSPVIANPATTAAGVYTLTVADSHGCTATASTAPVVVNSAKAFSQTVTACGSYTVGATTHTSNGTYTDVITTVGGCDSTVTTNLTINAVSAFTQTLTLCSGQSVIVNGHTYTSTGTYVDKFTGGAHDGCDSIVTTNLTVYYGTGGAANYSAQITTGVNGSPYYTAIGDFNGDGKLDFALTSNNNANVWVYLGNGTGGFGAGTSFPVGTNPRGVVTGDFNGDGKLDLAVANAGGTTVTVLLGNGGGSFTFKATLAAGTSPFYIVTADFNDDGKADLAVSNSGSNNVSVFLGDGTGNFTLKSTTPTLGSDPNSIAVGDFNGDGKADMAVVDQGSNDYYILTGAGDGTFTASATITGSPAAFNQPWQIITADFNGDGKADLALNNRYNNNISVMLGNGNGTFGTAATYATGTNPLYLVSGDFNGDGKQDIATANYGANTVTILVGDGSGGFTISASPSAGSSPWSIYAADFNGDTKPDLLIVNGNGANVSVLLNNASLITSGSASATTPVCTNGSNSSLALTGPAGIATYSWKGPNSYTSSIQSPVISDPATTAAGIYSLTVADSHGCTASASTASVVVNSAKTFSQTVSACGSYTVGVTTHTGNGTYTDLITTVGGCDSTVTTNLTINMVSTHAQTLSICAGQSVKVGAKTHTSTGTYIDRLSGAAASGCDSIVTTNLTVYFNGVTPSFSLESTLTTTANNYYAVSADFNNDGYPDLVATNSAASSNYVYYFKGNGDGTYGTGVPIFVNTNVTTQRGIVSADFNGDGNMDIAIANQTASSIYVMYGKGDGTFQTALPVTVGASPSTLAVGYFNNDSYPDLAVANHSASPGTVTILLSNGSGGGFTTSATITEIGAITGAFMVTVGDFNNDTKADIAMVNTGASTNGVQFVLGNGDGTFSSTVNAISLPFTTSGPTSLTSGDYTGDGNIDIAVPDRTNGKVEILVGNGAGGFSTSAEIAGAGSNANFVTTADLNGDGKPDIAVGDATATNITVLLNNGSGSFSAITVTGSISSPWGVCAADVNGDGKVDLISSNSGAANITVLLNTTPTVLPTISATATPGNICLNDNSTLAGSGGVAYSWAPTSGLTLTTGASITASPAVNTTYTVTGTDAHGCINTGTTTITLKAPVPLTVSPQSAVCTGQTNAVLTAGGAATYVWAPTGNLTPSAGTSATETAQISQLTFYTLTGTGADGCTANQVVPVATVATGGAISPAFSIICSGGTNTLTVTGEAGHDYQWQISTDDVNWTNITGATNTTYTTASGDGTTNKFYRLMAQSNSCWNVASTTGEVDVSNPNIVVTATNVTDNSLTLNWSPTGTGNYSISYSGPSSATTTSVTPPKTITGLSSDGTYSVTVTQTGVTGCPASGTITGEDILCAMPTGVTLSSPAPAQIQVSWTGTPGADYRVYYRPLFSYTTYFTKDVSNASSVLLTKQGANNIYASTTYEVYVSRLDCPTTGVVGQGTNPTNVTTLPTVTCATPVIDSVRSLCPVQIEVFIHDNGVNQYNVFLQRVTPSILAVNSYGVSGTYFTINTPYSGDQYIIAVEARCGSALSAVYVYPGNVTVKPLCNAPTNLVLSNPTCYGFTASWNDDQCLSNSASGYDFYLRVAGTINYNSYGVTLPGNGIGPNKLVNWATSGRTYQVFVRSIYNCNGFVTYGPTSQVETITTLSSGCRDEDATQPQENKPAVQQYSQDNSEVFSLYPNPNTGKFIVNLSRLNMEEDAVRIEVFNMLGQTVLTHLTTISGGHMSEYINLPGGTAAGTYIVRLTAGKNVYTAKINISK